MRIAITITSLLLLSLFAVSCKHGKNEMILGAWYGEKFQNPEMDAFFTNSQRYIDTIGKNGDAATNIELYGSANIDSVRHILQQQYDSTRALQGNAVKNTIFTFMKDSIVVISFDGRMDTSKWHFINDNQLEMTEMTGNEKGNKVHMDVLTLTDNALTLKFEQEHTFSTVTFGRGKK